MLSLHISEVIQVHLCMYNVQRYFHIELFKKYKTYSWATRQFGSNLWNLVSIGRRKGVLLHVDACKSEIEREKIT